MMDDNNNGMVMPVAPMYGGGNGGFGGGFGWGGDWAWILLLLLIGGNGWGMGGFGGGMMWPMMMGGMEGGFGLYPWLNNSQHISDGFRDQALNTQIGDLRTDVNRGFGDIATQLCGGFAGVNQAICQTSNGITSAVRDGFSSAEIANNARQMANMQQLFGVQSTLQQCCCDNKAGIESLRYTVATENCQDRQTISDGVRDILAATQAQNQRIIDKLCDQELQAERRENEQLRSQLQFANMQASQVAQTAELRTAAQTANANLLNELRSCPIPAMPVYGNQSIFQCNGNGCGCGCGQ